MGFIGFIVGGLIISSATPVGRVSASTSSIISFCVWLIGIGLVVIGSISRVFALCPIAVGPLFVAALASVIIIPVAITPIVIALIPTAILLRARLRIKVSLGLPLHWVAVA